MKKGDFINSLSKSEYEILALFWSENRGLTAGKINDLVADKSWKITSIHLILNSMLDRRILIVDGMVKSGRTYSRIFKPAMTPEEYSLMQIKQNTSFAKDQKSAMANLCVSLIDSGEISNETISKIEALIKKKKEAL